MSYLNQRGFVSQIVIILILLLGLGGGFLLVNNYGTQFINKAAPALPSKPEASFNLELEKGGDSPFTDEATPEYITPGSKFRVDVYARSDNDEANLFAAKLKFPTDLVQVVDINKRADLSFANKWADTAFDNSTGNISIAGGVTAPGIRTDSKAVFLMASIIFEAKQNGKVSLDFTDATAIYRNADSENILSAKRGISFDIKSNQASSTTSPAAVLTCKQMIVNGAVLAKTASGELEYITEPEKEINISTDFEPLTAKVTVKWEASGGEFSMGSDGGNTILTKWNSPKNNTQSNQTYVIKAKITNKENTQEVVSCPDVNIVVKPTLANLEASALPSPSGEGCSVQPKRDGDLNRDGSFTLQDLSVMLRDFGKEGLCLEADLDGNGRVSALDYSKLLVIFTEKGVIKDVYGKKGSFKIGFNTRGIIHYGKGDIVPLSTIDQVDKDLEEMKRIGTAITRLYVANNKVSDQEAANRLDEFLIKASTYGVSVIVSFIDFYNTGYNPKDMDLFYTDSWDTMKLLGRSFYSGGYKERYFSFIKTVIEKNKQHSNIYAWEPGNELSYRADPGMFLEFMQDTTSYIKMLDPNHSIGTGMMYAGAAGLSPAQLYPRLTNVDIITVHSYDKDRAGVVDADWAIANNKKLIVEEVGFSASPFSDAPDSCNPGKVNMSVTPSQINVGETVTFNVSGEQGSTFVEDTWTSGSVDCSGGFWGSKTCNALSQGSYIWTHKWKNCSSNLGCSVTSEQCSKQLNFTISSAISASNSSPKLLSKVGTQVLGVSTVDRSADMKEELNFWKSKGAIAALQWAFVAKEIEQTSDGDFIYGMDTIWHSDYENLVNVFKTF